MEKSFKRKMLAVAVGYFLLSVWIWDKAGIGYVISARSSWDIAWKRLWTDVCNILQPQFWVLDQLITTETGKSFQSALPVKLLWILPENVFRGLLFVSIPLWSLCFGWLYAKAVDRLNRFPVLGYKLF